MIYRISEVYKTIQGEGGHAGTPVVLVRMQGCSVGCGFCDTKYSWPAEDNTKAPRAAARLMWSEEQIIEEAQRLAPAVDWLLITGGEPCEQDLAPLLALARQRGYRTMVETSGTAELRGEPDHLTLSPKFNMPGGREVLESVVVRASEVKWVVGKESDVAALRIFLKNWIGNRPVPVFLQPLSLSERATALCVQAALEAGQWRVSVQTHRMIGLP